MRTITIIVKLFALSTSDILFFIYCSPYISPIWLLIKSYKTLATAYYDIASVALLSNISYLACFIHILITQGEDARTKTSKIKCQPNRPPYFSAVLHTNTQIEHVLLFLLTFDFFNGLLLVADSLLWMLL